MAKKASKTSGSVGSLPDFVTNSGLSETQKHLAANAVIQIHRQFAENLRVLNETTVRKNLLYGQGPDPRRDIADECGYPSGFPSLGELKEMYDKENLGARVVEVLPQETWKIPPYVYENEKADPEDYTDFENGWNDLVKILSSDPDVPESKNFSGGTPKPPSEEGGQKKSDTPEGNSFYYDEQANPIWEKLSRADKLSGIGHYGVIFFGLDDGLSYDKPVNFSRENKVLFLRVMDETLCPISTLEENKANRRFGRPKMYDITFSDPANAGESTVGLTDVSQKVHFTRIQHICDNPDSSELFGVPRQRPVWRRLLDASKLYGSSAEMYYKGAFFGLSLETHPELGGDVELPSDIKDQIENYQNGLQRILAIAGTTVKSIAPQVVDPEPQLAIQINGICIKLGIPLRIFMGSERGKLASTQDDETWKERVKGRRFNYVIPNIIVPFVNRLIAYGALPAPKERFYVKWPDTEVLNPLERADIALKRTDAMTRYVSGEVQKLMNPRDYLTRELGYSDQEAEEIIDNREEDEMLTPEPEPIGKDPITGMPIMPDKKPIVSGGKAGVAAKGQLPNKQPKDPRRIRSDTTKMSGKGES